MARQVGRGRHRLGTSYVYDEDEATLWESDVHHEAEAAGRARPTWAPTEKRLTARAAKCPGVYDKATTLQKKSRVGDAPACNDADIGKAVLQAFAGPCKKAEKAYRKALKTCKRIGR